MLLIIWSSKMFNQPLAKKKLKIIKWLNDRSVKFHTNMLKIEFLQLVRNYRETKEYLVDQIIRDHGYKFL